MSYALHAAGKFFIRKKAEFPQQYKETIERAGLFQSIAGKRSFRYSCDIYVNAIERRVTV